MAIQDIDDFSQDEQSAFNMGLAILYRIDKILTQIAAAKLSGEIKLWYASLYTLKGEIYYKLKDAERKEIDTLFNRAAPLLQEANKRARMGGGIQNPVLNSILEKTETQLKTYFDKRGMLGVTKRDPRYALSSGM